MVQPQTPVVVTATPKSDAGVAESTTTLAPTATIATLPTATPAPTVEPSPTSRTVSDASTNPASCSDRNPATNRRADRHRHSTPDNGSTGGIEIPDDLLAVLPTVDDVPPGMVIVDEGSGRYRAGRLRFRR